MLGVRSHPQKWVKGRRRDAGGGMQKQQDGHRGGRETGKSDMRPGLGPQDQMIPDLTDPFTVSSPVNNFREEEQRS